MKQVVAAIIVQNERILIARRAPGQSHAGLWEFPGGKREEGESLEQALVREIREELGLDIEVGPTLGSNIFAYKGFTIELSAWNAAITGGWLAPAVHDEVRFILPCDLDQYAFTPADLPFVERLKLSS